VSHPFFIYNIIIMIRLNDSKRIVVFYMNMGREVSLDSFCL